MQKDRILKLVSYSLILFISILYSKCRSEPLNTTTSSTHENYTTQIELESNITNPCLVSCEECGENSKHCIFNPLKCTIKCECKDGFTGPTCNQTLPATTTLPLIDFYNLKEKAWITILTDLNTNEFRDANFEFIDNLFKNINILFDAMLNEQQIDSMDVFRLSNVVERLSSLSARKLTLNENITENIFGSLDNLISLNDQTNLDQNNSSLRLANSIDKLTRYFDFKSNNKYFQFSNLKLLVLKSNPFNHDVKFELNSIQSANENTIFMDSISLNEEILKKRYKNNTIKVAFKIYFNYKIRDNSNTTLIDSKRDQFNKQQNELHKPRNFFYEITKPESSDKEDESEETKKMFSSAYFVSSNVLSAVIYKHENSHIQPDLRDFSVQDKFVRIQFGIDVNQFNQVIIEKNLKCVFWNLTNLEWSTYGCFASPEESRLFKGTKFYQKVCYCSHLTNFALLFDPNNQIPDHTIYPSFQKFLTYLTLTGIFISSICYLILIISRLFCVNSDKNQPISNTTNRSNLKSAHGSKTDKIKSVIFKIPKSPQSTYRNDTLRALYLSNAACLLISNLMFILVLYIKPSLNLDLCQAVSALLHYFLISSFCFSLGIAWQHFNKLVKIFKDYKEDTVCLNDKIPCKILSKFIVKWFIFSIVFPLGFSLYGYSIQKTESRIIETENCWLKTPDLYYLFIAPVTCLLILSLVFYIVVTVKVLSIYNCFGYASRDNEEYSLNIRNVLNSSYNNRKVVVILTFSFISLGLTWLIGIFIVISYHIDLRLKMIMEFLFCLFNSFHGLTLLIGNRLALKYTKSSDSGSNRPTSLKKTSNLDQTDSNETCDLRNKNETVKRELSMSSKVCMIFYWLFYCSTRVFRCRDQKKGVVNNKTSYKNKKSDNNSIKRKNKPTFLEFSIINYEDSDSNNQHLQTLQTHLPGDSHVYTEYLPNYFKYSLNCKTKTEMIENEKSSISIEQDCHTSSI